MVPQCRAEDIYPCGLFSAIRHNQIECINYLLPFFRQTFDYVLALNEAALAENVALVKHLIPLCNEKCGASALMAAISKENREIFDLLLPMSDPKDWDCLLVFTVEVNRPEFFDILLPLSNPNANNGVAFRKALELGYSHFAEILYPLVNVPNVIKYIYEFEPELHPMLHPNLCALEAKMQKNVLNSHLQDQPMSKSVGRKM